MNIGLFRPVSLGPYEIAKTANGGQGTVTHRSLLALELTQWVKFPQSCDIDKNTIEI